MRLNKFLFLALFALVCFASQLKADLPSIIWSKSMQFDINNISLSPDGLHLAIGGQTLNSSETTAIIVNSSDGSIFKKYYDYANSSQCKFSPSGKYLTLTGNGFTIYNFETEDTVLKVPYGQSTNIVFSPDESKFIAYTLGKIEFWDFANKVKYDSIIFFISPYDDPEHAGYKSVYELTYSPDGKYISYFSEISGGIVIMNAETHKVVYSKNTNTAFGKIAFSPDGKTVAFTDRSGDTYLEILDLDSMKIVDNLTEHWMGVDDFIYTKDSKNLLLSGSGTLTFVKKYNIPTKNLMLIPGLDKGGFGKMQLSKDEKNLFVYAGDLYNFDISPYMSVKDSINPELSINLNLSQNILNLSFPILAGKEFLIRIANIEGQVVKTFGAYSTSDNFNGVYDISDLASGSYILSVQGAGINSSLKFNIAR